MRKVAFLTVFNMNGIKYYKTNDMTNSCLDKALKDGMTGYKLTVNWRERERR